MRFMTASIYCVSLASSWTASVSAFVSPKTKERSQCRTMKALKSAKVIPDCDFNKERRPCKAMNVHKAAKVTPPSADDVNEPRTHNNEHATRGQTLLSPRAARIEAPLSVILLAACSEPLWMPAAPAHAEVATFKTTMRKYFPTALSTSAVSAKVRSALADRKFTRDNTLYGTCISPDEINTKPKESLSMVLEEYLSKHGGIYALGGIGGLPLQGIHSMAEFLSHCPRKGNVFLLFGPNVGISDNGTIGKIERLGQSWLSECCEPGLTVFDTIQTQIKLEKEGKAVETNLGTQYNELDSQMGYVLASLRKLIDTPEALQVPRADLPAFMALQMFKLGHSMIMEQLQSCLLKLAAREGVQEVVLLGGIIVSRGQVLGSIEPREDYFQPMVFQSLSGDKDIMGNLEAAEDLFVNTFGDLPPSLDFATS